MRLTRLEGGPTAPDVAREAANFLISGIPIALSRISSRHRNDSRWGGAPIAGDASDADAPLRDVVRTCTDTLIGFPLLQAKQETEKAPSGLNQLVANQSSRALSFDYVRIQARRPDVAETRQASSVLNLPRISRVR